jgi:predicted RNA-binding Zn-ribbon protein involved in translation (DUF1610 family)
MNKLEIFRFKKMLRKEDRKRFQELIDDYKRLLEREPCEDCVSRQAALNESYAYGYGLEPEGYCVDVEDILALPPVTPARKKGEWIKRNNDYFDWYECSECGYGSDGEMRYSREYDVRTNYCPKCGTQMLEVENEIN